MHNREFFSRWCKKNISEDRRLEDWLQIHTLDEWLMDLHISNIEVGLDQYGVLAICKGYITTFCRMTLTTKSEPYTMHFHFNMNGYFICLGSTEINGHAFSNLPNGMVNPTQIIQGKRKPNRSEAKKILRHITATGQNIYYSPRVKWASQNGTPWQLGNIWPYQSIAVMT